MNQLIRNQLLATFDCSPIQGRWNYQSIVKCLCPNSDFMDRLNDNAVGGNAGHPEYENYADHDAYMSAVMNKDVDQYHHLITAILIKEVVTNDGSIRLVYVYGNVLVHAGYHYTIHTDARRNFGYRGLTTQTKDTVFLKELIAFDYIGGECKIDTDITYRFGDDAGAVLKEVPAPVTDDKHLVGESDQDNTYGRNPDFDGEIINSEEFIKDLPKLIKPAIHTDDITRMYPHVVEPLKITNRNGIYGKHVSPHTDLSRNHAKILLADHTPFTREIAGALTNVGITSKILSDKHMSVYDDMSWHKAVKPEPSLPSLMKAVLNRLK